MDYLCSCAGRLVLSSPTRAGYSLGISTQFPRANSDALAWQKAKGEGSNFNNGAYTL